MMKKARINIEAVEDMCNKAWTCGFIAGVMATKNLEEG